MAMSNKTFVKDTMAAFLYDEYSRRRDEIRRKERRNFSQNEWAEQIGMVPVTLGRYMGGDQTMTMDQAVVLLRYFGPAIIEHFDYRADSSMDEITARIIATLPRMSKEKQLAAAQIIEGLAFEGSDLGDKQLSAI